MERFKLNETDKKLIKIGLEVLQKNFVVPLYVKAGIFTRE